MSPFGQTVVLTGEDEMVDPREELMIATPERKADTSRRDVDQRVRDDPR